jgi:hypothetical protein
MQKWHRELVHRLRAEGISVTEVRQGAKSTRVRCAHGTHSYTYHVATSASDFRAMENAVREIVRGLRLKGEHGSHA